MKNIFMDDVEHDPEEQEYLAPEISTPPEIMQVFLSSFNAVIFCIIT